MKKLELVTSESGNIKISSTSLSEYYLEGNGSALFCNDSNQRLSRASELSKRLEARDWNIYGRRYMSAEGENICYSEKGTTGESINVDISNGVALVHPRKSTEDLEKLILRLSSFSDGGKLKEIYDNMNNNEVYLYSTTKNTVDILNNSVIIDIIPYSSDVYTNTVDLGPLTSYYISPNVKTKIDIGIQYSKNTPEEVISSEGTVTGINYVEKLYSKETTFLGFSYSLDNSGKISLLVNNYVESIGEDVVIEFVNNVIRVIPKSNDVDECIISNCTVTYGRL